jgi:hypothetical protein
VTNVNLAGIVARTDEGWSPQIVGARSTDPRVVHSPIVSSPDPFLWARPMPFTS